jgi:diaminopimelate epimerase
MRRFYKLSGGGNDFLAVAEPSGDPGPKEIESWCRRGVSIGADGLFIVTRQSEGVRMVHFNSDGAKANLCLNGTRCAARLAFELGWAEGSTRVTTDAGAFEARDAGPTEVELRIPTPEPEVSELEIRIGELDHRGWLLDVGVPHLVLISDGPIAQAPVASLGPVLRHHPAVGSAGANIDFVIFPEAHEMQIRSFERGVEAETLACGTGVLASAIVGLRQGLMQLPVEAMTLGGFRIGLRSTADSEHWLMRGDARLVAQGDLLGGASAGPEPPGWD